MRQYYIRVTNTARMVLAIVFTPLLVVPLIALEAIYGPPLPEWALVTMICLVLGLAIAATLYVVKKIAPPGVVTVTDDGFSVDFPEQNLFTPASFEIKINQIDNFYIEGSNGLNYMSFSTTVVPPGFNIEARSRKEEDLTSFLELMEIVTNMIAANNEANVKNADTNIRNTDSNTNLNSNITPRVIGSVTMYERPWAKILLVISALIFVGVLLMAVFMPGADDVPWWRLSALLAFGLPFAYKVYYHNYKKKKQQDQ